MVLCYNKIKEKANDLPVNMTQRNINLKIFCGCSMIKNINGKVLNTDTASLIGEWKSKDDSFSYVEKLYRNHFGQYFIYSLISSVIKKENIDIIDYNIALKWISVRLHQDEPIHYLRSLEDDCLKFISTELDLAVYNEFRNICASKKLKIKDALKNAVDMYYYHKTVDSSLK